MNDVSTSERLQGPHAPLMRGNSFRMITCEGHCFKEFIALEDLVLKSGGEDPFCVPRYDGCERTTVNVHLPENGEEGGKGPFTFTLTMDDPVSPTYPKIP